MPGCAAFGCNNRSEKGYSMKCFPRDPQLRKIWKERVGRANWEPSKNSFLCHVHFEPGQWIQAPNGKIRLKKDAMPSIFKETSTRKSPKKQRLENGQQSTNVTTNDKNDMVRFITVNTLEEESEDGNYVLEYLEDCEYELALASNQNKAKNNSTTSKYKQLVATEEKNPLIDTKHNFDLAYRIISEKDIKGSEKENIIIVSDENNREIGRLIHNNENIIIVADENNKEIGQIMVENNFLNTQEVNINKIDKQQVEENYDEIEEKLKQICNGEDVSNNSTTRGDQGGLNLSGPKQIVSKTDVSLLKKNNIEQVSSNIISDAEIPRNVQIIFGTESGEESMNTSEINSSQNNQKLQVSCVNNEMKNSVKEDCTVKNKSSIIKPINLNDGSLNRIPKNEIMDDVSNIRSDVRQKSKAEVMRVIEQIIADTSERILRNIKNEQLKHTFLRLAKARKKENKQQSNVVEYTYKRPLEILENEMDDNSPPKKSKFTIKVTGMADDVNEIMEGLDTTSVHAILEIKNEPDSNFSKDILQRTSSKHSVVEEINAKDLIKTNSKLEEREEWSTGSLKSDEEQLTKFENINSKESKMEKRHGKINRKRKFDIRREIAAIDKLLTGNKGFSHMEELKKKLRKKKLIGENGKLEIRDEENLSIDDNDQSLWLQYLSKFENPSKELQQKIYAQKEVIKKLTNQLIVYKGLESKLTNLKLDLQMKNKEIKILREKLDEKSQISSQNCKKELELKQQLILKLKRNVSQLEEANQNLLNKINTESQDKKVMYQLKQKDERIKELNWKLQKASKFLERADKNANTYKKKMLSMQTFIKRQKASVEKQSHFKELLIDSAKHEFSESALRTAIDIKNTCGIKCYEKLLNYNFPLPSLRTLRRRFQKENVAEEDWGEGDQESVYIEDQNNEIKMEPGQTNVPEETEIAGTVQDIFEENNDMDDLNSSELGEHIFSEFERDMNT